MEFVFRAVGGAIAAYGAAYILIGIANPGLFLDLFAVGTAERRGSSGWRIWVRVGLTFVGLGAFFYCASYAIFQFIPLDWGGLDEDGDWRRTRDGFQALFAILATGTTLSSFEKVVETVANRDLILADFRALEDTLCFYGDDSIRLRAARKKLEEFTYLEDRARSEFVRRSCREDMRIAELTIERLSKSH